ncbi:hypothetical protein GWK47_053283 [Chionoecetes opilio]|uniref:Uncharacterized protein n=1 Tax=Chionoecetes opilio TaxID=41210 RepID=A0A8J4Y136_CHIOP|nr:hypothetical protein GWK47_053283 [Chionoecetes opilio]
MKISLVPVGQGLGHVGKKQGVNVEFPLGPGTSSIPSAPLGAGTADRGAEGEKRGTAPSCRLGREGARVAMREDPGEMSGKKRTSWRGQDGDLTNSPGVAGKLRLGLLVGGSRGPGAHQATPLGPTQACPPDLIQRGQLDLRFPQPPYQRSMLPTKDRANPPCGGINSQKREARGIYGPPRTATGGAEWNFKRERKA